MNQRKLPDETILFFSVLKWVFLATVVGSIVGLATTGFLKALRWSILYGHKYPYYYFFLPIALFISVLLIQKLAPDAEGHGTEKVIEAIHKHSGRIKPLVVPVKLVATIITIVAGGSVGKEGPCAQIGAGLASSFASLFQFNDIDRRKLVICGISGGFAAVFGTPLAGSMFGVEVLSVGDILYDVLLPSFISGITSYQVSSALGITYFYHPLNFFPAFSELFFGKIILAGIFFGICSIIMIEIMRLGEHISEGIKISKLWKGIIGGCILILLSEIFSREYLGLGLDSIQSALEGKAMIWNAFLLKSIFTSITLSMGGSGGIVTPIFYVGASAGSLFATLLHLDVATFAAIGLVALLAGCTNSPISASIMSVELFGPKVAPYAAVACVISFLITGHRSVYPSQVLSISKSGSLNIELGKQMVDTHSPNQLSSETILAIALKGYQKIKSRFNNHNDPEI